MNRFTVNNEMFGKYVKILTNYNKKEFIYKVISLFESNTYQDVPIKCGDQPTVHDKAIPVLNVVQCGIDESKVIRVALKDCFMVSGINNEKEVDVYPLVHAHWDCIENVFSYEGTFDGYECSHCHKMFLDDMCQNNGSDYVDAKKDFKYCPFCGAKMDGKENKHETDRC